MNTLPQAILDRSKRWPTPPRGYAYHLREDTLGLVDTGTKVVGVDEKAMCATFVITTDDPDRVGDVVEATGISLQNFAKNPIGFYGHQVFPLPIGKWEDPSGQLTIALEPCRATGTLYFSQRSGQAEQVFALVAEGILRATSIGFNPLETPVKRGDDEPNSQAIVSGFRYPRIDLLEVSIVGVPAQANAVVLRSHLSRGQIAGHPISPAFRKSLEPLAAPPRVWAHGWNPAPEVTRMVIPGRFKDVAPAVTKLAQLAGWTDSAESIDRARSFAFKNGSYTNEGPEHTTIKGDKTARPCPRGVTWQPALREQ